MQPVVKFMPWHGRETHHLCLFKYRARTKGFVRLAVESAISTIQTSHDG